MPKHAWRSLSRSILVFTNVVFLLLGCVLLALGVYMVSVPSLKEFTNGGVASGVITSGLLVILIAFLGCCGAQRDSKVFLFPYTILVCVSVIALLSLTSAMVHIHGALLNAENHDFNLSELEPKDRSSLEWIQNRFQHTYDKCDIDINVQLASKDDSFIATCNNRKYEWFAVFLRNNCRLEASDLLPTSKFLSCAGANFQLTNNMDEKAVLCACQTRMTEWMSDQSMVISVFVGMITVFEIILVSLSCYIMCSRRGRGRYGYQEIRMPTKTHQPYNPHPRNFLSGPMPSTNPMGAQSIAGPPYSNPVFPTTAQDPYSSQNNVGSGGPTYGREDPRKPLLRPTP